MSSQPLDLFITVVRGDARTLGRQIEDQLRVAIRNKTLRPGARLPSTRDLARELDVSRPIVVDAYAQLAAEGYVELRQGARPRVSGCVRPETERAAVLARAAAPPRYDFRPGVPDLSAFPRPAWLRALREALATMPDADLGYTDRLGSAVLRQALSDYLGRVRGVVSDPSRVIVTSGYHQGRMLVCRALAALGVKRVGVEEPCHTEVWESVSRAGLELVPIPVDACGMKIEELARSAAGAVVVTPAHQYPTGAVLSGARRAALLEWLRRRDAIVLEDDYDAEYRYDRAPVGALQALDPGRVVYAGTASKTLAPALRLGWLVLPPRLLEPVAQQQSLVDFGGPRIEQHAFAGFLARGELDRHLRRMRGRYRARRDALVAAVARRMPDVEVCGIAAGLHAVLRLPPRCDAAAIRDAARRRGIALTAIGDYYVVPGRHEPALLVGYAGSSEEQIESGVAELAKVMMTETSKT